MIVTLQVKVDPDFEGQGPLLGVELLANGERRQVTAVALLDLERELTELEMLGLGYARLLQESVA